MHLFKAGASRERRTSNACNAVRNGNACKSGAPSERSTSNACNAVGDCNACKAVAIIERILSNACNAVRYCNACKSGTTTKTKKSLSIENFSCKDSCPERELIRYDWSVH